MSNTSDADQAGQVALLYTDLLQLMEQARQLQAESSRLLDRARQTRAATPEADNAALPDDTLVSDATDVPLTPEDALDAIITLLGDFSLETQIAITKALGLGVAATVQARLNVKRPPVA